MLNAFRHQRESHRIGGGLLFVRLLVLNAFRHQRESHKSTEKKIQPFSEGAQRLSASKRIAHCIGCRRIDHVHVLNAFRHQRESHPPSLGDIRAFVQVLNAFRHQRESHICALHGASPRRGAQRLSASKRIALASGASVFKPQEGCSTPFGIKENRTGRRPQPATSAPSAQRLSASKRIAPLGVFFLEV